MKILNKRNFTAEKLNEIKSKFREKEGAFHVVIDDFFNDEFFDLLHTAMVEHYSENKQGGVKLQTDVEFNKWGSYGLSLPKELLSVKDLLCSQEFLEIISQIIGVKDLCITSEVNENGFSFFHVSEPGGYLGPHTDHTRDRILGSRNLFNSGPYHVANIIIYITKDWEDEFGGRTQFYGKDREVKYNVEFKANRALIFLHTPSAIHGTEKILESASKQRFSIYFDFYSASETPFQNILRSSPSLHGAPHLFYLTRKRDYFYWRNRKYLLQHFRACLGKFWFLMGGR
jgi:hypothetical protein